MGQGPHLGERDPPPPHQGGVGIWVPTHSGLKCGQVNYLANSPASCLLSGEGGQKKPPGRDVLMGGGPLTPRHGTGAGVGVFQSPAPYGPAGQAILFLGQCQPLPLISI